MNERTRHAPRAALLCPPGAFLGGPRGGLVPAALWLAVLLPASAGAAPQSRTSTTNDTALFDVKKGDDPTFIDADSLTLDATKRVFTYSGKVKVTRADMILTSDVLDGRYDENNRIKELVARKNVTITKGPTIRATSNKAVFDAASETVTLSENPQLFQEGSLLSADVVKVYVRENRSTAEGQVRMKLLKGTGSGLTGEKK